MKKYIWIIFVVFTVIGLLTTGCCTRETPTEEQKVPNVVGTYSTDEWNGGETAVLTINADGSCRYPSGDVGTWTQVGDKIIMVFFEKEQPSGTGVSINSGVSGTYSCTVVGDVDGLILNGFFFEKIS